MINPATFSPSTQWGLISEITLTISGQRYRASANPFCRPADENGWHGKPPDMSVTVFRPVFSKNPSFVKVVISRKRGTAGHRFSKTEVGKSAHSHWHTVSKPAASAAKSIPPMPENRLKCVKLFTACHLLRNRCHKPVQFCIFRETVYKGNYNVAVKQKSLAGSGLRNIRKLLR